MAADIGAAPNDEDTLSRRKTDRVLTVDMHPLVKDVKVGINSRGVALVAFDTFVNNMLFMLAGQAARMNAVVMATATQVQP